MIHDVNQDKTP